MKLNFFSIVLFLLLFSVVGTGMANNLVNNSESIGSSSFKGVKMDQGGPISVLDERIDYTILSGGEVHASYSLHVSNIPAGLDLSKVSQNLYDKLLWSEMEVQPMPNENMALFLVLDTTDPTEAESLAQEALKMVTERPNPNFIIAGLDIANQTPWNKQVSIVRLEGSADYLYYLSLLGNTFYNSFAEGIPRLVNLGSLFPVIKLGVATDISDGSKFSIFGYQRDRTISQFTGFHSFSLISDLGVSNILPTEYSDQISINVDIPIGIDNLSYSPNINISNQVMIYQTNRTADIRAVQEETYGLSYWINSQGAQNVPDITLNFDYEFYLRELQGSETLLTELNPYGFISKAYLGEGSGLELSSSILDELHSNNTMDVVVNIRFELRTDMDDNGDLAGFHALTMIVSLTAGASNYSIARDLASLLESDYPISLSSHSNGSEFAYDPYTNQWEQLNTYSFSSDINNGFTMTGETMLSMSPAWDNSSLVSDFDYNGTNYLDYYFIAELYRHMQFNNIIVPKLSIVWPGIEVFDDLNPSTPHIAPGTLNPTLHTREIYGLSTLQKSPGFASLNVAFQVPNNEGTLPGYAPGSSGDGYTVLGFAEFTRTPFTVFSGISNVDTKTNSWLIYSDNPTLPDSTPLTDINITLSYTILSNDQDVLSPVFAALAFEADNEYTTNYLENGYFNAYKGTVFGPTAHTVARFNGTEYIYPLIQDYWGVYLNNLDSFTDIFDTTNKWKFLLPNSTITDVSMEFTYGAMPIKAGEFFKTASTTVNNSLIWYSSMFDQTTDLNVDRGGPSLANFTTGFSWDTTQYADGDWLLNVTSTDSSGNVGTDVLTLKVDNWAGTGNPGISLHASSDITPYGMITTSGQRIVIQTTADNSPIFGVGLTFMGKTYAMQYDTENQLYYWDLPFDSIPSGTQLASMTVFDYSGGSSTLNLEFYVDKQQEPEVLGYDPVEGSEYYNNETILIIVNINDQDGNGIVASLKVDSGISHNMMELNSTAYYYEIPPNSLTTGIHTVYIQITDNDVFQKMVFVDFNINILDSGTEPTGTTPIDNSSTSPSVPFNGIWVLLSLCITTYSTRKLRN